MAESYLLDEKYWSRAVNNAITIIKTDHLEIGILEISQGVRLPKEGYSVHGENDEFAYILSGEVIFGTDKESIKLAEGSFLYNKKGTPHYVTNLEDKPAKILWVLSPPR
ncbi:MAG: cupin domain-containing protein [Candidatus Caldarchaeales archaeon]